jgi:SpoVK/Ycf46/Vps4 family AAA+-type ATPase
MASRLKIDSSFSEITRDAYPQVNLVTALHCLDEVLQQAVARADLVYGPNAASDPYRGLYINEDEITRLFSQPPGEPRLLTENQPVRAIREKLHTAITAHTPFVWLTQRFSLTVFDLEVIVLALAAEVDLRYERLFSYLQDNVTLRRPSVDLALNLFCDTVEQKLERRRHFSAESALVSNDLICLLHEGTHEPPLLSHFIKLDRQITNFLLGERALDARIASFCQRVEPKFSMDSVNVTTDIKRALCGLVRRARTNGRPLRCYFHGPCGADKRLMAEALAKEAGTTLLKFNLNQALNNDFPSSLRCVFRHTSFEDSILFVDDCDALIGDRTRQSEILTAQLLEHNGIVFLAGEHICASLETSNSYQTLGLFEVAFVVPEFSREVECWRAGLEAASVASNREEQELLGSRFRLGPAQISQAVVDACQRARWQAASRLADIETAQPTLADLCGAARAQAHHQLGTLARKIDPLYTWSDIVLPDDILGQLQELCTRVAKSRLVLDDWGFGRKLSLGKGISALFAGPSGTGKTMAAEIIANDLELDLYKIDLSGIVSKYIGETEKNLDRIFTTAETANAILFFDEADALFGKRSEVRDSHDRYANIEISYLLQKMEQYEGIAILATNLRQNLDEAFLRRLQIVVEFPFPNEEQRRQIWEQLFPAETPRAADIDFDLLAQRFRLAGGNIKNIVLGSAFLAAANGGRIDMRHLLQGARGEYQKLGKLIS